MKVTIINKSDATGGAAIVSYRLMEALTEAGVDARMVVADRQRPLPRISLAASPWRLKAAFLKERLGIFLANGMNRETLFKIDTAADGVPLHRHPWVREADVICLDWVNQGLLSLKGLRRLGEMGKPIVWTMHDMWNMTGICHHAGVCGRWRQNCGCCPLMNRRASADDLSARTWKRKKGAYDTLAGTLPHGSEREGIAFVAVSNWLADKARMSSLLRDAAVHVIPNAFPFDGSENPGRVRDSGNKARILFGAARLDDPIKGLPVMIRATQILADRHRDIAHDCEIVTFGRINRPEALSDFGIDHRHLGVLRGHEVKTTYEQSDIVLSASSYETLPGTLVEGQAWGCVPVSTLSGGQEDIVEHESTGYLVRPGDSIEKTAAGIADGVVWAYKQLQSDSTGIRERMLASARSRFAGEVVAARYIDLFNRLLGRG